LAHLLANKSVTAIEAPCDAVLAAQSERRMLGFSAFEVLLANFFGHVTFSDKDSSDNEVG
jgi:hypothetical protein